MLVAVGLLTSQPAFSPDLSAQSTERKEARATRVASGSVRIDGRLDEEIWQRAVPLTDFVQAEPNEGAPPTDAMDVRIVYDETALYIGARLASGARAIQAPMSRRDDGEQAEYLQIELDTFLDRRTAYMFGITASGVRLDHFHPTDSETDVDDQFDPVWEAKTAVADRGWTAELWIPFSQLRFNDQPERIWGLNVKRSRPQLNEQDYWVVIGRTQTGWASRFGDLRGIEGLQPKSRLEMLPYVASSSRMTGSRDRRNPFDNGVNLAGRVGADMKLGVGPNLTLEATVNPDFGQIEADPAEVNLTVFETIFDERRPFFIEGNNRLEPSASNYYYSRRIGARPTGPASGDYTDYPDTSTILGAAKLTGRLHSGTSLGFLGALTAQEDARTSTGGLESFAKVAPQTSWGVARLLQEIGRQGSTIGAHLTLVHRDLAPDEPLASLLPRQAVTTGADGRFRFKDGTYEATFNASLTHVGGEPAAIERVQRATTHLFQRPDQPRVRLDPTRRSITGNQVNMRFEKIAGRHWLWGATQMIETPEFEPTDFGRLNYAGDFMGNQRITYRETRPGRVFRAYSSTLVLNNTSYFDTALPNRSSLSSNNSFTFHNFWVGTFNLQRHFRGSDVQLTRGGPTMGTPFGWNVTTSLRNSTGARTRWSGTTTVRTNELGDSTFAISGSISARPSPSVQFSFAPEYLNEDGTTATQAGAINRQFLTSLPGGRPETYGRRYVFGLVDRTTVSAQFRFNYTFKPDVTLDVYAEPFAASGRYNGLGELQYVLGRDLRMYGTDGTTIERQADGSYVVTDGAATFTLANRDFNIRSFRSNVVLRWEWRPGSTLYFVWQQNRADNLSTGEHVSAGDLFGSFNAPGDNILAVKTTFWISR
jgi:hypothetical protein